uniref:G-protein coupled receptors family 2 profile 1 domain-containing protein n=1 Tax=Accipiter nisus TaxID=211598 RepID=A0A8B9MBD1_9AVES
FLITFTQRSRMVPSLTSTVNYTDPTLEPVVTENSVIRQKIIDSQFKCYERMNRAPPYKKKGLFCNRTWDGWLCWDDTPAGRITAQNCPDYFPDFDPTGTYFFLSSCLLKEVFRKLMPFNGSMFPVAFLKHCEILESLAEIKMGCLI